MGTALLMRTPWYQVPMTINSQGTSAEARGGNCTTDENPWYQVPITVLYSPGTSVEARDGHCTTDGNPMVPSANNSII